MNIPLLGEFCPELHSQSAALDKVRVNLSPNGNRLRSGSGQPPDQGVSGSGPRKLMLPSVWCTWCEMAATNFGRVLATSPVSASIRTLHNWF